MNELYYIRMLKDSVRNYREKSPEVIQCSCPICGDSRTDTWKARFYFLFDKKEYSYYVNCHNCNYTNSFKWFLRSEFPDVFKLYMMEEFKNSKKEEPSIEQIANKMKSVNVDKMKGVVSLKKNATLLKDVNDKEVIEYCKGRSFSDNHYNKLYFTDNFGQFNKVMGADRKYHNGNDKRIIIPFIEDGVLVGWQGRSIDPNNKKKYITVSLGLSDTMLFGVDDINESKTIFVTEGALDSLFLNNSIAVNGMNKFDNDYTRSRINNCILVLDNEKRNRQVTNEIKRLIDKGFKVYYNNGDFKGKDINDYFHNEDLSRERVESLIKEKSDKGLMAKLNYIKYLKS